MNFTRILKWGLLIALASWVSRPAEAETIFTDLGSGGSFGTSSWTIQMGEFIAFEFSPSSTATLSSIELAVGSFDAGVTGTAYLAANNSGEPGATLASWSFAVPQTETGALVTLNYPTIDPTVTLQQGTDYWVYLGDNSAQTYSWFGNSTGYDGAGEGNSGSSWSSISYGTPAAFQINGPAVVPEPASLMLSTIGAMAVAAFARLKRNAVPRGTMD